MGRLDITRSLHSLLSIALALFVTSCIAEIYDPVEGALAEQAVEVPLCEPHVSTLFAGGHIAAGTLTVSNLVDCVHLEVATGDGWVLTEVQAYAGVAPAPLTPEGEPAPHLFPYKVTFDSSHVTNWTINIPFELLGVTCDGVLNVALHASLVRYDAFGVPIQWAEGWALGPGEYPAGWGWWFPYTICCEQPPTTDGCTLTQGYWTHHNRYERNRKKAIAWPVDEDTELCGNTWYDILQDSQIRGSAWLTLAHQWIAAKLNAASGASVPSNVGWALAEGGHLLSTYCDHIPDSLRELALGNAEVLDLYNNGGCGVPHCE